MKSYKKHHIQSQMNDPQAGKVINLSNDVLSIADYEWLSTLIKKSSFIETILLPNIPCKDTTKVLEILNKATINNSTLTELSLNQSLQHNKLDETARRLHQQIQSRLQRNKQRVFAIHGGGNIGLGLMADVVSRSPFQYNIVATTNNLFNLHLINSVNKLWIQHGSSQNSDVTCIEHVSMVSREQAEVTALYKKATIAALCVTPAVMPQVAKDVARGLLERYDEDKSGLKILVLMNIPKCASFVHDKIETELLQLVGEEKTKHILQGVEFVPTVVDRIVTPISPEKIQDQIRSQLIQKYSAIFKQSDSNTSNKMIEKLFINEIDDIINSAHELSRIVKSLNLQFNLFNAEKTHSIYVPDSFIEAKRLPELQVTHDLIQFEAVKNKYINGPHAILAWIGALFGYDTVAQSIRNPMIHFFIKKMMDKEIVPILQAEYPNISKQELKNIRNEFFQRCAASENDPVSRVGRDPLRKLDRGGRIRGTLELAKKHNLRISTSRLEQGIAAGFLYSTNGKNPTNPGCIKIMELYNQFNYSWPHVLCYSGVAPSGQFTGLHPKYDKDLLERIETKINELSWNLSLNKVLTESALIEDTTNASDYGLFQNRLHKDTNSNVSYQVSVPMSYNY